MSEQRELQRYAQQLNSEVRDRALGTYQDAEPDYKENVFTGMALEMLEELGVTEESQVCYYEAVTGRGQGQIKVNGYSTGDPENHLDIFTTLFHDTDSITPVNKNVVMQAIARAHRLLEFATCANRDLMEPTSEIYAMVSRVQDVLRTKPGVRIFVLSDGLINSKNRFRFKHEETPFDCEIWDIERLYRATLNSSPRDSVEVDFEQLQGSAIPCLQMPYPNSEFDAYLTILPGETLYWMYENYGPRLLEFNVRSFLQAKGGVNRGIRETLKKEPDRFVAYNNGISATADSIETIQLPNRQLGIRLLRGFQIVNGGQTTASIHRARKVDKTDISQILVPTKICIIRPEQLEEFVPKISRYANTQNVIQMADFSANDTFHIEIERLSKRIWCPGEQGKWFYERARGQYQVAKVAAGTSAGIRRFTEQIPPSRKFTKLDLAKYIHSWEQLPHIVSKGAQKNFVFFMEDLASRSDKEWIPDEVFYRDLIAKAIVFRSIQRLVRQEKFPAYQANIVTYTTAYLSYICRKKADLTLIWKDQRLSSSLEALLQSWTLGINEGILQSSNGRNVTEWCKKEECWQEMRKLRLPLPDTFPQELQGMEDQTENETTSEEDRDNIETCMMLSGEAWLKIHGWGKESGALNYKQCSIALTLSGMAEARWVKEPSRKQAWHGAKMLELARNNGVPA
jgi:hypothetical protein